MMHVYVTGIGIVSPAGCSAAATWDSLLAGGQYVGLADDPNAAEDSDVADHSDAAGESDGGGAHWPAGRVRNFTPPAGMKNGDRVSQFAMTAAQEALTQAGFSSDFTRSPLSDLCPPERIAVSVGTSKGGILSFSTWSDHHRSRTGRLKTAQIAHLTGEIPPDAPARHIARRIGATGPVHATVAACSTGTLAVIRGMQFIHDEQADLVICGSSDASIHPLWLGAFERMGVLAAPHPEFGAAMACRPFDQSRAGFAIGEGAGILVLASEKLVARRTIPPIARLSGYAMGSDPTGISQLSENRPPLAEIIRIACRRAQIDPESLSGIIAHGTGTIPNDRIEIRALREAIGSRLDEMPIVSIKGVLGHLLGGAGAVELAIAAMACQRKTCPGNRTLITPDPALGDINLPPKAFSLEPGPLLKTSLGFGGHLAAVVLNEP